jgi:hypothetical protein
MAAVAAGGPGWAGGRQLSTAAAGVLQALLEPSEYEAEAVKQVSACSCRVMVVQQAAAADMKWAQYEAEAVEQVQASTFHGIACSAQQGWFSPL